MIIRKTKILCAGQRVALCVATLGGACDALSTISWATIPVMTWAWGRPSGQAAARDCVVRDVLKTKPRDI